MKIILLTAVIASGALLGSNLIPTASVTFEGAPARQNTETTTTAVMILPEENPFSAPSVLPFEAPDFAAIKTEHYMPAFEAGIAQAAAEIQAIASNSAAPTFENTVVAMEKSGELLSRVQRVFSNMTSANTNDEIQAIQRQVSPMLSAHSDNIYLNPQLFDRFRTLYQNMDALNLNGEQQQLLRRYYRSFVRAGALLDENQQVRIRQLNERMSALATEWQASQLAITRESAVVITDVAELDGLSQGQIAAAAAAARNRGLADGNYLLSITNTIRQPILTSLNNRDVRQRVFESSLYRGLGRDGRIDVRPIVLEIAAIRAERAQLMGYNNFAEFAVELNMAENPQNILDMLTGMVPAIKVNTEREANQIRQMIAELGQNHELMPWDWEYYAEKVREKLYDIDENEIKQYFELESVLNNGVFYTMTRLYGIEFRERFDLPVYHPSVRVWDVIDHNGEQIALFYGDFFARDSKRGGAWMSSYVGQSHLLGTKPVVVNVLNIPEPAEGQPALVSFSNVVTLFHEMGHGVHGMFSDVRYPSVAGTATPRDFVEFPSTFEEDWAVHPEVLANYARHYETGELLPSELLDRVIAAQSFNQGFDTFEYVAASLLDQEWHMLTPDNIPTDVEAFEQQALAKYGMDWAFVPPRYTTGTFNHIWPGGYSANYYAYIWSEILAADAFAYVKENGGLSLDIGTRYREAVLSRGGSIEPMQIYINFRGQEPTVDALLRRRGLDTPPAEVEI
jgi:peptidyl-dipeptidase Dcp